MTTLLTEFRQAIESNDLAKSRALLEQDRTLASSEEYHPLYNAAIEGNFELAKLLLDYGADVDMPPQRGTGGAIHEAVVQKHYDIANLLYDHGAAVDATPDACTPTTDELYYAAIEAGAPPDLVRLGFEDHLGPVKIEKPNAEASQVVKLFHRVLKLGGKPTLCSVVRQENHQLLRELLEKKATEPADRYDSPPGTVFAKIADAASWLGYPEILELCREVQPELYDAQVARHSICRAIGSHNRDGCHPEYYRLIENQLKFLRDRNDLDLASMVPLHWLADNFLQSRTYGFKCQQLPTVSDLIEFAQLFLKYGFDVNFRCAESKKTPLAVAAGHGPVEYVDFLIKRGADLCADDPDETNPRIIAENKGRAEGESVMDIAALRCVDAIPWLLEIGVEQTLNGAVGSGDTETVRSMIGADPDSLHRERLYLPLTLAVMQNRREMVDLLLQLGADPNYPTPNCPWGNPMLEAAERNNVELLRVLLKADAFPTPGADSSGSVYDFLTNWGKRSAVEIAEAQKLLLEYGADPYEFEVKEMDRMEHLRTASDKELLSPFWDGTFLTHCKTPELLDAYVARFGNDRIVKGPWYEMCKAPWSRELTETMMRHGYNIDHGDWLGRTELHAAAASNEIERAKCLLDFGADPNLLDAQHSATPLGFAARQGHVEMVKLLLEHGADKSLPAADQFAWARPLESAEHFLANHDFRFSRRTSNQGELTGRYTKSPQEQYEAVIELLN